jgi:hypothetical protein
VQVLTSLGSSAPLPLQCGHIVFLVYFTCISFPEYKSSKETFSLIVILGPVLSYCYLCLYIKLIKLIINVSLKIIKIDVPSSEKVSEKITEWRSSLLHSLFIDTFFTALVIFTSLIRITKDLICWRYILKLFKRSFIIRIFIWMMN